jgi:phytoene dehydrogenase-like protein
LAVSRNLARTHQAIARFSAADADAWQRLFEQYLAQKDALVAALFSPPPSFATEAATQETTPGGMDAYRFSLQSLRSWCEENFEAEQVKCLLGAFAAFVGHGPDDAGGAEISWLFAAVLQDAGNNFVKGGMHKVSQALAAYLEAHGGTIQTNARVDKILVSGNRAVGVRLSTGEEIAPGRLVASVSTPPSSCCAFSGRRWLGRRLRRRWRDTNGATRPS